MTMKPGNEVTTREELKNRLNKILKNDLPLGIVIKGEWGIGKTHFWSELIFMPKDNTENNLKEFYENITTEMKNDIESDRFEKLFNIFKSRYLSNFGYFLSAF